MGLNVNLNLKINEQFNNYKLCVHVRRIFVYFLFFFWPFLFQSMQEF